MTIERTKLYQRETMERIRRMSLVAANMEVRNGRRIAEPGGNEGEATDTWFDNRGDPMATTTESQA